MFAIQNQRIHRAHYKSLRFSGIAQLTRTQKEVEGDLRRVFDQPRYGLAHKMKTAQELVSSHEKGPPHRSMLDWSAFVDKLAQTIATLEAQPPTAPSAGVLDPEVLKDAQQLIAELDNPLREARVRNGLQSLTATRFAREIVRLAASHRPKPEPDGWQPIETAPKDGTHILVEGGEVYWHDSREGWFSCAAQSCILWQPRVWAPLPVPSERQLGGKCGGLS